MSAPAAGTGAGPRIGVLGGGQLARMLAQAARPLGIRVATLDPAADACAADRAQHIRGDFDDPAALRALAAGATCVTYETETVPPSALARVAALDVPVRPGRPSLVVTRDRLIEKRFLARRGIPTAEYRAAASPEGVAAAVRALGGPVLLKTRTHGYDGRGQLRVNDASRLDGVWARLGARPLIVERIVPFRRELSLVSVRSLTGEVRHYPLVENEHAGGILRVTHAPADVTPAQQALAEAWATALLSALDHVGVFTMELFETGDGLMVNELAPRVHNSGHWTIEGAACSQFENHLRAVLGWPLGPTAARGHARMVNLIGRVPADPLHAVDAGSHVHLYGKTARENRKLGHVTLVDGDRHRLDERVARVQEALARDPVTSGTDPAGSRKAGPSRRQLLRGIAAGAAALVLGALPLAGAPALRRPRTPREALGRLVEGNARFVEGRTEGLRRSLERVRETASGQTPFAAILGCADSRVPPEILFDQGVGDLFVVRVAGNVVTPEEIASLEYAVAALGSQLVLVLGHSSCGAVKAAFEGDAAPGQITTLYQHLQPAVAAARGDLGRAVALNVEMQRDLLRSGSPLLRDALRAGTLAVEGGVYDLETGRVRLLGEAAS